MDALTAIAQIESSSSVDTQLFIEKDVNSGGINIVQTIVRVNDLTELHRKELFLSEIEVGALIEYLINKAEESAKNVSTKEALHKAHALFIHH